jgi:hypothetical protein
VIIVFNLLKKSVGVILAVILSMLPLDNLEVHAVMQGSWQTNVAIICDNGLCPKNI